MRGPWQRQATRRYRRALHDVGGSLAISQKLVEHLIQLVQRRKMELQHEAILARDPVTFHHLRQLIRQFRDPRQRARTRADADEGAYRVASASRVHVQPVAADDPSLFEAKDTLAHGRGRHTDAPRKCGDGEARVVPEVAKKLQIPLVAEHFRSLKAQAAISYRNS